ncbi:DNA-binding protein [Actinomyces sp. 2119]|uniref:helix-turn-helix domain-containing protein n=1 Tax=Actinomyces sp. 2119 TaxID=2321393 RepID=UPI000E6D0166|nr:helix-turn-helix domain-containing protein [Actinomyces sp. 2119]RJF44917.1 DNA-binding protein [Actinomyces sp. 2119]
MTRDGLDDLFADLPPVLSVPEVATVLGMTKAGVYRWLADGTIPGYRVAKSWFIVRDELKQTLRQGRNTPNEE